MGFEEQLSNDAQLEHEFGDGYERIWTTYQGFGTDESKGNIRYFNGDISDWDTSQVTKMFQMFRGCISFNRNIGNWDTSK